MALSKKQTTFEGLKIRYWEGGHGLPVMLLHGSGPGVSTFGNFRLVLEPLAERYHLLAFDLIGFGESDRKKAPPYFDLELWFRQARAMLQLLPDDNVGVLGHSISASLALRLAAVESKVARVLTTGAMGTSFRVNEHTVRTWTFPESREDLRRAGESLVYDTSIIDDAWIEGRTKILHDGDYGDYFRSMFTGDKQRYVDAAALDSSTISKVRCPVLMIHGRDDKPFPFAETTLPLGRALGHADIVVLSECGHSPALEQPQKLIHLASMIFG